MTNTQYMDVASLFDSSGKMSEVFRKGGLHIPKALRFYDSIKSLFVLWKSDGKPLAAMIAYPVEDAQFTEALSLPCPVWRGSHVYVHALVGGEEMRKSRSVALWMKRELIKRFPSAVDFFGWRGHRRTRLIALRRR